MYTVEEFIKELENEKRDDLFFSENIYSGNSMESIIRRHNLSTYLLKMKSLNPKLLLLGEAPGYKGCKLTGVPFTSEKILASHPFFKDFNFKFINKDLKSERSSTIVWNVLQDFKTKPLTWNIFPFHPYLGNDYNTNRTPNKNELQLGKKYLIKMLQMFKIEIIVAVGRKSESKLVDIDTKYKYVRHPSNGGQEEFIKGITEILNSIV